MRSRSPQDHRQQWYSFDGLADRYDETRTIDSSSLAKALRKINDRHPLRRRSWSLEIGIGTGRIAIPFAETGRRIVGIDISRGMLRRFRAKTRDSTRFRPEAIRADATRMPFRTGTFSMVYWVNVLHLVPRWRAVLDEAIRVAKSNAALINFHTEGGRDVPKISESYNRFAYQLGFPRVRLGVRRGATIMRYLARRGYSRIGRTLVWKWTDEVAVGEALDNLGTRVYSTMRRIPIPLHQRIMRKLRASARREFGLRNTVVSVGGAIRLDEVRKR